jgi:hypothetical protein
VSAERLAANKFVRESLPPLGTSWERTVGRGLARFLFFVLVTCATASSAFESSAGLHQRVAMSEHSPMQDFVGEGRGFVKAVIPSVSIEDASEPFGFAARSVAPSEFQPSGETLRPTFAAILRFWRIAVRRSKAVRQKHSVFFQS